MIIYFSGTGNTEYVAKRLAQATGDALLDLRGRLQQEDYSAISGEHRIVLVTPTYAWRIPRIVEEWLQKTPLPDADSIWFVMTCGGEIGNAAKYNIRLAEAKGLRYMGTAQILMPDNYIVMFNAPDAAKSKEIVDAAEPDIEAVGKLLTEGAEFGKPRYVCPR